MCDSVGCWSTILFRISSIVSLTDVERRSRRRGLKLARLPFKDDPAKTAKQGYDAMMRGDQKVVASSMISKLTGAVSGVVPDSLKARGNRLLTKPFGEH